MPLVEESGITDRRIGRCFGASLSILETIWLLLAPILWLILGRVGGSSAPGQITAPVAVSSSLLQFFDVEYRRCGVTFGDFGLLNLTTL